MSRHNDKGRKRGKSKHAKIMEKAVKKYPTEEEAKLVVELPQYVSSRQRRTEERIAFRKSLREALAEGWHL